MARTTKTEPKKNPTKKTTGSPSVKKVGAIKKKNTTRVSTGNQSASTETTLQTNSKSSNSPSSTKQKVSQEKYRQLVAEEAYFIAERRGFQSGDEATDWLEAEKVITRRLGI